MAGTERLEQTLCVKKKDGEGGKKKPKQVPTESWLVLTSDSRAAHTNEMRCASSKVTHGGGGERERCKASASHRQVSVTAAPLSAGGSDLEAAEVLSYKL